MKLTPAQARALLASADHGVLGTRHEERGVDLVPVVFAMSDDGLLGIPIDTVKPKIATRLQRERNLESDSRATLLVDHWDAGDWSQLWWVRARLLAVAGPEPSVVHALAAGLAERYPQYRDRPFARILVFEIAALSGWAAQDPT